MKHTAIRKYLSHYEGNLRLATRHHFLNCGANQRYLLALNLLKLSFGDAVAKDKDIVGKELVFFVVALEQFFGLRGRWWCKCKK